jgi:Cell wall protein YJL171C/Tos1, N-terminal
MSLRLAALIVAAFVARVNAQCQQIAGNYYCAQTNAIIYNNVGFSGTYNEITNMDSTSCQCSSSPQSFSGGLAPLNQEVLLSHLPSR